MLTPNLKKNGLVAAGALALVLQGCASMSRNECMTADWYTIGYESGIRGQRESQVSEHRKACAEHGVTPNLARYLEGREAGMQKFCEPGNGYRLGRAGTGYAGVCPSRVEGDFLRSYRAGRELYDMQLNINRLGRRIKTKQAELKNVDDNIADKQAELIAAGTTAAQRALLLTQLLDLQEKAKDIQRDIYYARVQRDSERARLASAERARP